jgi:hypothetical protein
VTIYPPYIQQNVYFGESYRGVVGRITDDDNPAAGACRVYVTYLQPDGLFRTGHFAGKNQLEAATPSEEDLAAWMIHELSR